MLDKDRVIGSAKQVKGTVKQVVGKAMGDAKLESEGQADKIEGKAQNVIGGINDAAVSQNVRHLRTASRISGPPCRKAPARGERSPRWG